MEKLLRIMRITSDPHGSKEFLLSAKIEAADPENAWNFCLKCFAGHFYFQFSNQKGWALQCNKCSFRVRVLQGAGQVSLSRDGIKCQDCNSRRVTAMYKDDSPFPAGEKSRTGCVLCDTYMRSTIVNSFFKQQRQLTAEELEAQTKAREEKQKLKEERRKQREEEEKNKGPSTKASKPKKEKAAAKCNILSEEDRVNEFMRKLMGGAQ